MKKVIKKGNLAFNHMIAICDICKRWNCEFTKDDKRICKYNKDDKGLYNGAVINHMQNYKCKYYKRLIAYNTCKLQSKSHTVSNSNTKYKVQFKRGKFKLLP
ncbi:hypothetical protein FC831_13840 [Clostridium botulinum]|nr:hypothetical protein [Clostridium botulinum]